MRNLIRAIIASLCLVFTLPQAQAAPKAKAKAAQAAKENLVLMPLRLGEADLPLQGAMETALLEGLQQKYQVFTGDKVDQRRREVFAKESKKGKTDCDETKCLQDIAAAFNSELLAVVSVAKQSDGYFLAINIRNLWDDKVVYSKSVPCKGCDAYAVIDKLKELVGTPAPVATASAEEEPPAKVNLSDPETALWEEAKKGNAAEDYQAYLSTYPKGKYAPLAKTKLTRMKDEAKAVEEQQEQQAWSDAQESASQESYSAYLSVYPKGRLVSLAQARISKLQKEETDSEAKQRRERLADEARKKQGAAEAARQAAAQNKKLEDAAKAKEKADAAQAELSSWNGAEQSDTEAVYNAYLKQYPIGIYASAAKVKLDELHEKADWLKVEGNRTTEEEVYNFLRNYPKSRYGEAAKARIKAIKMNAELKSKAFKDCAECPEMMIIPKGSFQMGELFLNRRVVFEKSFAIGKTEITQLQWNSVMGNNFSNFKICGDNCPMEKVSWEDAKIFIAKLSEITGKKYRLPSESEWEYACRAGTRETFCGSDNIDDVAWTHRSGRLTHPVALKHPNAWGLYDMSGNVFEWTEDSFHDSVLGEPTDGSASKGDGKKRSVRGGSFDSGEIFCTPDGRTGFAPFSRVKSIGFRVVRELDV